jgi:hypothetical protein
VAKAQSEIAFARQPKPGVSPECESTGEVDRGTLLALVGEVRRLRGDARTRPGSRLIQ